MLNNKKNKNGFTLLEGIVAIFLVTVGIGGAYTLISQTISSAIISSQKLIASYLVQEGIEIVRNIRDTNWLEGNNWNDGLSSGDWEADYKTQNLTQSYTGNFLNIDSEGFYSYSSGSPTIFKRKISISPEGDDILKVIVVIEWQERGRTHQIRAQENLYNWR